MKALRRWMSTAAIALVLGCTFGLTAPSTTIAQADMPYFFGLVHVEPIGDPSNPQGIRVSPNGQDLATAPDGSSVTMSGSGAFNPASGQAQGGGQYTIKDPAGAVMAQGAWRVTGLVSFEWWPGGFPPGFTVESGPPPPGTVPSSGLGKFQVHLEGQGDGILTVTCVLPTTPESISSVHHEGIMLTVGQFNFNQSHEETPTGIEATIFFVPAEAAMPTGMPRTGAEPALTLLALVTLVITLGFGLIGAGLILGRRHTDQA